MLSQLAYFLLNKIICRKTSANVDGSFVATILETAAVAVLVGAWVSITEGMFWFFSVGVWEGRGMGG